jgi:hypothetical protein
MQPELSRETTWKCSSVSAGYYDAFAKVFNTPFYHFSGVIRKFYSFPLFRPICNNF